MREIKKAVWVHAFWKVGRCQNEEVTLRLTVGLCSGSPQVIAFCLTLRQGRYRWNLMLHFSCLIGTLLCWFWQHWCQYLGKRCPWKRSQFYQSLDVVEGGWSQVTGHIFRPLTGCTSHKTTPVNIEDQGLCSHVPIHQCWWWWWWCLWWQEVIFETESHVANTGLELLIILPLSPMH